LKAGFLPACVAVVACSSAHAGPADYVFLPSVSYGEREIDFKYGAAGKENEPSQRAASLGLGYGATEWWFTDFYVKGEREGASNGFDAIEWENKFQLTEPANIRSTSGSSWNSSCRTTAAKATSSALGLLFGVTPASPDVNFRMQAEFEF